MDTPESELRRRGALPHPDVEKYSDVNRDILKVLAKPPKGWWIMILECGKQCRLPLAPPASSKDPMLAAWPTQIVLTSGLMNCMVS